MKASDYKAFPPPGVRYVLKAPPGELPVTPSDILGPFYKEGSPFKKKLTARPTLRVTGRVRDRYGIEVDGAVLDVWQADEAGVYDTEGFGLRGKTRTVAGVGYTLLTVRPGYYDISEPTDPEPHEFRCAHIHVIVTAEGFEPLTTQLYFADSEFDDTDRWFDARRCIDFGQTRNPNQGVFDFVLERVIDEPRGCLPQPWLQSE